MEINKIITKNPNYQFDKIITNNPSINQNLAQVSSKIYTNVNKIETRFSNNIETRFSNKIETRFPNNMDLSSNKKNPNQFIHSSKSLYHNSFLKSGQCLDSSVPPPVMGSKKDDTDTKMINYYEKNLAIRESIIKDKGYCEPVVNKCMENNEQSKIDNISKIITKKGNEEHKKGDIHLYDEKNKKIFTPNENNNKHFIFEDQKNLRYSIYGEPMNVVTLEYNLKNN